MQAQAPAVQRLQVFLSESPWEAEALNTRRLDLLLLDEPTNHLDFASAAWQEE